MRYWWQALLDVFPDFAIEIVSVRESGEVTVASLRNRAHGEEAGRSKLVWQVCDWRDG